MADVSSTAKFVIRGGEVLDQVGRRRADVLVEDGHITAVENSIDPAGAKVGVLDASGCVVTPGLVDIQVHFREPGGSQSETIESGSRAAALGGFVAVVCMPNTSPAVDSPSIVREIRASAKSGLCAVFPSGTITKERKGEDLANFKAMVDAGVRVFTDDGNGVQDALLMRRAMEYSKPFGVTLAQHCQVDALTNGGVINEGEWSEKLGLPGWPAEAEELMVFRDIALARLTGARVHFLHMSSKGSVELIRAAKAKGIHVTGEAAPHHFSLTDSCCQDFDTNFKMNPPLRSDQDVDAIKLGFADNTLDAIATDHAPHAQHLKEMPFVDAPFGIVGLETALSLSLTELGLPIERVIPKLTWEPSKIVQIDHEFGRPIAVGECANITVVDPELSWKRDAKISPSRSRNDAFDGRQMTGRARHTIFRGEIVVKDCEAQR